MSGFSHHHTDEALLAYRALPVDQKLGWLEAARRMTADFLPSSRLRDWQRMRGDAAFTVPRERMLELWPRFLAALDGGVDGIERFAFDVQTEGLTLRQTCDLVEDFGDWIKVRTGWSQQDHQLWQAALEALEFRSKSKVD